jgi:salicylate hydroxylase
VSRHDWLVVGGGIGGLSAALALARGGQAVHVLERAAEFAEIGAGLQIGANATRTMARLGVLAQAEDVAVHPGRGLLMDACTGEMLTAIEDGQLYRQRYGYPYLVMHRGDLLSILLQACEDTGLVTFGTGKNVIAVAADGGGGQVTCDDGSTYEAAAIIGADGLRSAVRQLVDTSEPIVSGYVAYRGTMPIGEVSGGIAPGDVVVWIGPGMHLVQYPVRRGELYNQVAVFRSSAWEAGAEEWGTPAELDDKFSVACTPVREAVSVIGRDRSWPIYERDPLPTWRSGRAILIGDAAHPMLQYLGQGACQAMEDAWCLAEQVAVHGPAPGGLDKALRRFEEIRLPRTTRCQLTARSWGQVWHTADPVTVNLRNRVLRARAFDDYSDVGWLYADQSADIN